MEKGVYFISGIDTGIGKTIVTGDLARQLQQQGYSVITQKLVQTGNVGYSEDIHIHRQLMADSNRALTFHEDNQGLTTPYIFAYPASPHLASALEQRTIDITHIQHATNTLAKRYDFVLLEGAGGLLVPLTEDLLTIEYIQQQHIPVILVTSSRLGSINHTLLSLLALQHYGITLHAVVFNAIHDGADQRIAQDTRRYLKQRLWKAMPTVQWIEIGKVELNSNDEQGLN